MFDTLFNTLFDTLFPSANHLLTGQKLRIASVSSLFFLLNVWQIFFHHFKILNFLLKTAKLDLCSNGDIVTVLQ